MSQEFDMIGHLRSAAETVRLEGYSGLCEAVHQVIDFINSLPRQYADAWKPNLPSLEETVKIFNEHRLYGTSQWEVGDDLDSIVGPPVHGLPRRELPGLYARLEAGDIVRED